MLQLRSIITVCDNTGAKRGQLIGIPGSGNKKIAKIGTVVTVSIKEADPHSAVKKGDIEQAVIVRTRKEMRRPDGTYIRFDDNACVLLNGSKSKDPKGTRFFGPIAREVRDRGYAKIASSASEMY